MPLTVYIVDPESLDACLQRLAEAMRTRLGKSRRSEKSGTQVQSATWALRKPYQVQLSRAATELPDGRAVDHVEITISIPEDD